MSHESGLDQLCEAAACDPGAPGGAPPAPPVGQASQIQVLEIDAFQSVHDLIHSAIISNRGAASLKEVYEVCQRNGRIAYKRAGGSRLITANDHWKSQIRHALYTSDRFERVPGNTDLWQVTAPYANTQPQLVKVLVRADEGVTGAAAQGVALPVPAAGGSGGGARPAPSPGAARRKPAKAGAARRKPAKAGAAGPGAAGRGGGSRGRGRGRGRGQGRGSKSRSSTPDAAPKRGRRGKRRRSQDDSSGEDEDDESDEEELELDDESEAEEALGSRARTARAASTPRSTRGTLRAAAAAFQAPARQGSSPPGHSSSQGEGSERGGSPPAPPLTRTPRRARKPARVSAAGAAEPPPGAAAPAAPAAPAPAAARAASPSPVASPTIPLGARAPRGGRGVARAGAAGAAQPAPSDPSQLRWGATGLRSCLLLPAAESLQRPHSAAAGGTAARGVAAAAAAAAAAPLATALSGEADSPPLAEAKRGSAIGGSSRAGPSAPEEEDEDADRARPLKRRAAEAYARPPDATLTPSQPERPPPAPEGQFSPHASPLAASPLLESWAAAVHGLQLSPAAAQQLAALSAARGAQPGGMLLAPQQPGLGLPGMAAVPFPPMVPPFYGASPALLMAAQGAGYFPRHLAQQAQQQQPLEAQQAQQQHQAQDVYAAVQQVTQALQAVQQAQQQRQQQQQQQQQQQGGSWSGVAPKEERK